MTPTEIPATLYASCARSTAGYSATATAQMTPTLTTTPGTTRATMTPDDAPPPGKHIQARPKRKSEMREVRREKRDISRDLIRYWYGVNAGERMALVQRAVAQALEGEWEGMRTLLPFIAARKTPDQIQINQFSAYYTMLRQNYPDTVIPGETADDGGEVG